MSQMKTYQNYIGGQWVSASSGEKMAVVNPANRETFAFVQKSNAADVGNAIAAAKAAFETSAWRKNPGARTEALMQYAGMLVAKHEELSQLLCAENGKAINEARYEMWGYIDLFKYFAGQARNMKGTSYVPSGDAFCFISRESIGVVAIIVPWNWPAFLLARSLAPALAAGNSVVVKPASATSALTAELIQILSEVPGIPAGIVNMVTGPGSVTGDCLARSCDVDMIAFTGSTDTAAEIAKRGTSNMKKLSLELGGKSPNVIFADADLDKAIPGAVNAFVTTTGQLCMAGTRLLVQDTIFGEVEKRLKAAVSQIVISAGKEETCQVGPLVSQEQFDKVMRYLEIGKKTGRVVIGGNRLTGPRYDGGYFVEPTIFADLPSDSPVVRDEIFGPVLVMQQFHTEEEAIALANDTKYGLAGAVWSTDVNRCLRVASEIRAGTVWVNTYNQFSSECEFGGYKASGLGRELGMTGLEEYTELKTVNINIKKTF